MPSGIYLRTEEHKQKLSKALLGKTVSEETKRKMSESKKGTNHTKKSKLKISKNHKGMLGKNHTKESKLKMSEAKKGKIFTKEHRHKLSKNHKGMLGKNHAKESKLKMSEARKGKTVSEETKCKMQIASINRMINNKYFPNFNKDSIQYFNILNEVIFNNDGQYGINEYCILALGYWPDFISHKYKVIIEYDEKHHSKQLEKDEIRQSKIQAYYPDYVFIRIKEDNAKINILAILFANKMKSYNV